MNLYEYVLNLSENLLTAALLAAHCRTAGQPHTATSTAALPDTAVCSAAHCRTLPPHTA